MCSKDRSYIWSQQYIFAGFEGGVNERVRVSGIKVCEGNQKSKKVKALQHVPAGCQ